MNKQRSDFRAGAGGTLEFTDVQGRVRTIPDLTAKAFGRLTVLHFERTVRGAVGWKCQCTCGNTKVVRAKSLSNGETTSCGCYRREVLAVVQQPRESLAGRQVGRLTVLDYAFSKGVKKYWTCRCECGVVKAIIADKLRTGEARSCGCLNRERFSRINAARGRQGVVKNKESVLDAVKKGNLRRNQIFRYTGLSLCTVRACLFELSSDGIILAAGGKYYLTPTLKPINPNKRLSDADALSIFGLRGDSERDGGAADEDPEPPEAA